MLTLLVKRSEKRRNVNGADMTVCVAGCSLPGAISTVIWCSFARDV